MFLTVNKINDSSRKNYAINFFVNYKLCDFEGAENYLSTKIQIGILPAKNFAAIKLLGQKFKTLSRQNCV